MTGEALNHEHVVFDGVLTARNIAAAHSCILNALHNHAIVEIDCEAATEIDLSFVQLLLAARKTATRSGKSLSLVRPASGLLRDVLSRGGLLPAVDDVAGEDAAFWLKGASPR